MASVIISVKPLFNDVSQGEKSYVTLVILDIFKVIYKDFVPSVLCSRMIIQRTLHYYYRMVIA